MIADLHFHSKFSDGSFWPKDLVKIAKEKRLEIIALTDHDTFNGIPDFINATKEAGILGIPAIEIDFIDTKYNFISEILGYFPDNKYTNTEMFLAKYFTNRQNIALHAIEKARYLYNNPNLNLSELFKFKLDGNINSTITNRISITKADIYKYFIRKKLIKDNLKYKEFKKIFFDENKFKILSKKPELAECIKQINKDNGFAVLAHPALQFNKNIALINKNIINYKNNLLKLKQLGLWGIELHAYDSNNQAKEINKIYKKLAKECNLQTTFGSDSHGPKADRIRELGCIKFDFKGFNG